jgi:hypothetical protein
MVCFHLPWGRFSFAFLHKSMSGAAMGGSYWTVFAAAFVILAAGVVMLAAGGRLPALRHRQVRIAVALAALYGMFFLSIRGAQAARGVAVPFGRIHPQDIGISVQFGWVGTLLGFAAALIGATLLKEPWKDRK